MRRHAGTPLRRRVRRDQSGAAMVEFAMVVGLFALVLYAIVAFGSVLATKQRVTSAAADAARAAVGATTFSSATPPLGAKEMATNQVQTKLGTTGYTATYLPYTDTLGCASPAACIQVNIVYNLSASPGLGLVVPPSTSASAVVRYK
ncbi:MAG: pilus assembly protein [Actinomycetota bacterium]|nr:pilus assembly protein [Actinomycetota bacterium]